MLTLIQKELTYHHIKKKEHGGKNTIENGAVLCREIHEWLHNNIEHEDRELYNLINECLILYKICIDKDERYLIEMYENECVPEFQKRRRKR